MLHNSIFIATMKINSQSLEDTQVGYISQKKHFGKIHFRKINFEDIPFEKKDFGRIHFGKI